jgi:magnesium transporter
MRPAAFKLPGVTQPIACLHNADHADVVKKFKSGEYFWLDLEDPTNERIEELGTQLGLHPLTIADSMEFGQRARYEDFEGYASLVVHGVDAEATSGTHLLREVHVIISGDYVITIHRRPLQALDEVRKRYDETEVRSEQFMVYKILDAISQTFFPVLDRIDDDIDAIEETIIDSPDEAVLQRIFALKRDLVAMRRVVTPSRDTFALHIDRIAELPGMQQDDRLYFRDLYDTLVRVADMVDSYRDLLSGATDLYASMVANRQGDVNKSLTIIATVFLPLSFLTGFFGQNFSFLTGHIINHNWTFWWLGLGLDVLAVIGFIIYFRTRRWT